jgi:hypothetical protein
VLYALPEVQCMYAKNAKGISYHFKVLTLTHFTNAEAAGSCTIYCRKLYGTKMRRKLRKKFFIINLEFSQ